MQKKHKRFFLVRAKKALRTVGGRDCIILHRSVCTRANTSRYERGYSEEGERGILSPQDLAVHGEVFSDVAYASMAIGIFNITSY